jgi:hypothetical protein
LVDTNLFIAAIKNPKKETDSLRLLLELIDESALIGNEFLIMVILAQSTEKVKQEFLSQHFFDYFQSKPYDFWFKKVNHFINFAADEIQIDRVNLRFARQ